MMSSLLFFLPRKVAVVLRPVTRSGSISMTSPITWDWMPNQRFFVPILPFLGIGLSALCILLRRIFFDKSGIILVAFSCMIMLYQGFQSMQYRRTNHKKGYWAEAIIENTKRERNEYFPLSMSIPWKMHEKYVASLLK